MTDALLAEEAHPVLVPGVHTSQAVSTRRRAGVGSRLARSTCLQAHPAYCNAVGICMRHVMTMCCADHVLRCGVPPMVLSQSKPNFPSWASFARGVAKCIYRFARGQQAGAVDR